MVQDAVDAKCCGGEDESEQLRHHENSVTIWDKMILSRDPQLNRIQSTLRLNMSKLKKT